MRFMAFSSVLLGLLMIAAPCAFAARSAHMPIIRHQPHQGEQGAEQQRKATDTKEVQNRFFSITLPEGWKLQKPVTPVSDRVSAVFMKNNAVRVALNIFKVPFTTLLMAEKTAANMRKRGMEVSQPVEKDGFYVVDISKKGVTGKGWFGSNGSTGATTIIFAPDLTEANELLQALKPSISGIVPERVD